MADRLGRMLDPYPIAPSFDHFPSLNAPAPAPLASTHRRQRVNVSVWSNLPSVASTGTIFELDEIETFRESMPRRDRRWRCSIKMHRNDRICDLRLLIDISYTRVGVGGGDSLSTPASASSISAIFFLKISFSAADIFWSAHSTSLIETSRHAASSPLTSATVRRHLVAPSSLSTLSPCVVHRPLSSLVVAPLAPSRRVALSLALILVVSVVGPRGQRHRHIHRHLAGSGGRSHPSSSSSEATTTLRVARPPLGGPQEKNVIFSIRLWTNSEHPNLLNNMFIWSL